MDIQPITGTDAWAWSELLAHCFGRQPSETLKLWDWFQEGQGLVAWGAWEQGRLVAQYSCLLGSLSLPTGCYAVGISTNMAVHPDFRGRGLIKHIAAPVYEALAERGCVAGVGFSNAAGVQVDKQSKGYGYEVVGQLLSTITFLRPQRPSQTAVMVLTAELPPEPWAHFPANSLISFSTSPELVRARYAAHPFRQYGYGVWREQGEVRGVVVYRPLGRWGVALLGVYGGDVAAVLRHWASALRPLGVRFVHTLLTPASRLRAGLGGIGRCLVWSHSRSPHYLTVKPLVAEHAPLLLDYQRWDCVGGDVL